MLQGSLCASSFIIKCLKKILQQFFILGIIILILNVGKHRFKEDNKIFQKSKILKR